MRSLSDAPRAARCVTTIILAFHVVIAAAQAEDKAAARLRFATGPHVRPDAWMQVHIDVPRETSPADASLQVLSPDGQTGFTGQMKSVTGGPGGARFTFWVLPGEDGRDLLFRLTDAKSGAVTVERRFDNALSPLPVDRRLILSFTPLPAVIANTSIATVRPDDLPATAAAYDNCDLLVLGGLASRHVRELPRATQADAIIEWIALGGAAVVMTDEIASQLTDAARRRGWFLGRTVPFVLPPDPEGRTTPPPPMRRIGRGIIIYLNDAPPAAARVLTGREVWKRLRREVLPVRRTNRRLSPDQYAAVPTDWPMPPRLSELQFARWGAVWIMLMAAVLILPPVRARQGRTAVAAFVVSSAVAVAFLLVTPERDATVLRATLSIVGEAGRMGPTLNEDLWLASPFDRQQGLAVSYDHGAPPRPLFRSVRQARDCRLMIEQHTTDGKGTVRVVPAEAGGMIPARLLFERPRAGPATRSPALFCRETNRGLSLAGGETSVTSLYNAVLETARGMTLLSSYSGGSTNVLPFAEGHASNPRDHVAALARTRHRPGEYAVLLGWTTAVPRGDDLGVLQVHTLNLIRE